MDYKFLGKINSPEELKNLDKKELDVLCEEIRDNLINTVSKNGGHLASNLGVVELTIALHRSFNAPEDSIIFDVGHQCYVHKLLTGRYDRFSTIRKENGISGFMRPDESVYDPFVTGHASNSLAAAYGICKANEISGKKATAVAVIGDGALTGGLAFEALNNIGCDKSKMIVVLNDNKMSISNNVGSFSKHLRKIRLKPSYYRFKYGAQFFLKKIPLIGIPVYKMVSAIKRFFTRQIFQNNIFETMGFKYIGPVDGHNIEKLETAVKIAKSQNKPCVIHAVTIKGKGYSFAEEVPENYHGVSAFDTHDGLVMTNSKNFSSVCGDTLFRLAAEDERICAITAAMAMGTGLDNFSKEYSNRFFDVGIAEEYAATFAAGLATAGMRPYFAVYSSFLQRAYDQIIHDAAIAGLPVCYLVDRAGVVGDDGETHQGLFDAAFLTTVPGITVFSPASYRELVGCLEESLNFKSPLAIRYPRGKEQFPFFYNGAEFSVFENGGKIAMVSYGIISTNVLKAGEELKKMGISTDFIKLNRIYPTSQKLCEKLRGYEKVYLFEEGMLKGGISEHVVSKANLTNFNITAVEDKFVPPMSIDAAHKMLGLDTESIVKLISGEK